MAVAAGGFAVIAYVYLTLPDVRVLTHTNPTDTAYMQLRRDEAKRGGRTIRQAHRWVPYARISPNLRRAVLVAEDDGFFEHGGVDFKQLRQSIELNISRRAPVRGASTITQQLARNLYLSPSRDPLRKLREWIIARRLEAALPKTRILEIYLNVIEWGHAEWGAEAAARRYFGVPASALTVSQSALLAGAIINPRTHNPARPTRRLLNRQRIILARLSGTRLPAGTPALDEDIEAGDSAQGDAQESGLESGEPVSNPPLGEQPSKTSDEAADVETSAAPLP